MKVLCIADHIDPFIYSVSAKSRFSDINFILSAGDLNLDYYDFIVSTLNKPLYFVFGNHHLLERESYIRRNDPLTQLARKHTRQTYPGGTYLEGRVLREGGVNQYTNFTMFLSMLRMFPKLLWNRIFRGRYLDILLTHAPPYGINDLPDPCHTGFKIFLWFMRVFKPRYLIHGHVHLYDRNANREAQYRRTRIVNAFDHIVIELEIQE